MSTGVPTKEQAAVALAKLREMFATFGADAMTMSWEVEDDVTLCVVSWETGPFEWSYISPEYGGSADGMDFDAVEGWPSDMWTQARNPYQLTVWVEGS